MLCAPVLAATMPRSWPWRWARNQAPTAIADAAEDQQLIADDQAGQDHEGQTAEHQRGAGRHARQ